jgi:antitoxin VapB
MPQPQKARVFMTGRSQAVRIPAEFRFNTDEVYIRRDQQTGDLILSQAPSSWDEIFAELDAAEFPADFMADRRQGITEEREPL